MYLKGGEPDESEVRARVERYWRPYHEALQGELARIRAGHGRAVLWEGHSIRGELPFLFDGRLPDMNLGTASGASCSPALQSRLEQVLASQDDYGFRSEEHTSELQSLMRISYAVFCLKKKKQER